MNSEQNNINDTSSGEEKWLAYAHKNRIQAPEDFNQTIWNNVNKKNKRRRLNTLVYAAAACIIIAVSIHSFSSRPQPQSYEEKLALLLEAKSMTTTHNETSQNKKDVIYEDEMIIIYN